MSDMTTNQTDKRIAEIREQIQDIVDEQSSLSAAITKSNDNWNSAQAKVFYLTQELIPQLHKDVETLIVKRDAIMKDLNGLEATYNNNNVNIEKLETMIFELQQSRPIDKQSFIGNAVTSALAYFKKDKQDD